MYDMTTDLCHIMCQAGSDKGNGRHNYTTFYHYLFNDIRSSVKAVFELGLGTNNLNILSNMAGGGTPCGSLRGWSKYFENAEIFGADIDPDILYQETRIHTYYCDQTNPDSISELKSKLPTKFDIVVEDGLHTYAANICFFENFKDMVVPGGWFIIEDIDHTNFTAFEKYIESNKSFYDTMELVKIPNPKNTGDNNLIVIKMK